VGPDQNRLRQYPHQPGTFVPYRTVSPYLLQLETIDQLSEGQIKADQGIHL
jgi:hypothetical protein